MYIGALDNQYEQWGNVRQSSNVGSTANGTSQTPTGRSQFGMDEQQDTKRTGEAQAGMNCGFYSNINSVWADMQTGNASTDDEDSFATEMLSRAQDKFTELDVNGDGSLDEDEFLSEIQGKLDSLSSSTESTESDSTDEDSFATEMLSRAQDKFTSLDVNGDGTLDEDEFLSGIQERLDTLSSSTESTESDSTDDEDSFATQMLSRAQEAFSTLDANGDGTLDEDEFLSGVENMQSIQGNAQNPYFGPGQNVNGPYGGSGNVDFTA